MSSGSEPPPIGLEGSSGDAHRHPTQTGGGGSGHQPQPVPRPSEPPSISIETGPETSPTPRAVEAPTPVPQNTSKIRQLGPMKRHEEDWNRTPNSTGTGAIHVRTFHCKLTDDALRYMDQTINEWLDAHPQYEVKFVHSTVGTLTGKLKEPHLICQIWV